MSELREQMKEVKAPEGAQVIAQATGQGRKRQVTLFLIGALVAIAVFMALAAKCMKSPRRPDLANLPSLGMGSSGAAPMPSALRSALPPAAAPTAHSTATPALGEAPSAPQAQSLAPSTAACAAVPAAVAPSAAPSASGTAPAKPNAQNPAPGTSPTQPAVSVATPAPQARASSHAVGRSRKAFHPTTKAAPGRYTVAKRRAPARTAVKHSESQYDRIGISEE